MDETILNNLIKKIAPYPTTEDEATAQAVYRHLLVAAQLNYLHRVAPFTRPDGPRDPAAHMDALSRFVAEWSTLHLLRGLLGLPYTDGTPMPADPDGVVRDMWGAWDDGSDMAPALWEWLEQAGIDPEEIETAYEASVVSAVSRINAESLARLSGGES